MQWVVNNSLNQFIHPPQHKNAIILQIRHNSQTRMKWKPSETIQILKHLAITVSTYTLAAKLTTAPPPPPPLLHPPSLPSRCETACNILHLPPPPYCICHWRSAPGQLEVQCWQSVSIQPAVLSQLIHRIKEDRIMYTLVSGNFCAFMMCTPSPKPYYLHSSSWHTIFTYIHL